MKLFRRSILTGLAAAAVTTLSLEFGISLRPRSWPQARGRWPDR